MNELRDSVRKTKRIRTSGAWRRRPRPRKQQRKLLRQRKKQNGKRRKKKKRLRQRESRARKPRKRLRTQLRRINGFLKVASKMLITLLATETLLLLKLMPYSATWS